MRRVQKTADPVAAWRALNAAHATVHAALEYELRREHDLSTIEFEVLERLGECAQGKVRMSELAEAVHATQSTVSRVVARLEDVQVESLVLELRDLVAARGDRPAGPLARLIAYDRKHQSNLVETLRAWLDAFGDVSAASEALFLHPNTFRYRLRRVAEVGRLDLADPDQRFVAMLQLRVLGPGFES